MNISSLFVKATFYTYPCKLHKERSISPGISHEEVEN